MDGALAGGVKSIEPLTLDVTCQRRSRASVSRIVRRTSLRLGWADRSWAARIGGLAALATAASQSGAKCGIALLGTAIGVPLWVLFGNGAAVATLVLEEFAGRRPRAPLDVPADQNTGGAETFAASNFGFWGRSAPPGPRRARGTPAPWLGDHGASGALVLPPVIQAHDRISRCGC
jgi:hypothetical protein